MRRYTKTLFLEEGGGRFTTILSTLIAKEALKIHDNEARNVLQQTSSLENSYTLWSIPPNHAPHKHITRLIRNFRQFYNIEAGEG